MKKYGAILADPPWDVKTYSAKGEGRTASQHYDIPSYVELWEMDIPAADDCVLFMWVTDPNLSEGLDLMRKWGFRYKTVAFTWAKTSNKYNGPKESRAFPMGCGYWTRANPEMCLLGTRGKPKRVSRAVRQLMIYPRQEHSRKPDQVYGRIEALVGGPYLEMFARSQWPGWDAVGNEVDW